MSASDTQRALDELRTRIEDFGLGDRPMAPPAAMLLEERRLMKRLEFERSIEATRKEVASWPDWLRYPTMSERGE